MMLTYLSISPSTLVKKDVIFSDSTFRLSPRSSSWSMMAVDADMLVARTLSPRSCTAILASASSRDLGMTFSLAYMSGSNCFAMLATLATSGIKLVFHGCSSTQLRITVAIVIKTFRRVRVNMPMPFAKDEMVSSIGAVRNSVSPLMAKRTTARVSVKTRTTRRLRTAVHGARLVVVRQGHVVGRLLPDVFHGALHARGNVLSRIAVVFGLGAALRRVLHRRLGEGDARRRRLAVGAVVGRRAARVHERAAVPLVVALLPGGRRPVPLTLVLRLVSLLRGDAPARRVHIGARAVARLREAAALRVELLERGGE